VCVRGKSVMGSFAVILSQCVANQGRHLPDTIFKKLSFQKYNIKFNLFTFHWFGEKLIKNFFSIFLNRRV